VKSSRTERVRHCEGDAPNGIHGDDHHDGPDEVAETHLSVDEAFIIAFIMI